MSDNPKIQIRLEQSIDELLKSSPLPFAKDCLEPVGMCWYEVSKRFAALDLPSVEIIQGHHELHLDQVTQLTVVINEALGTDIQNISMVVRGLPDDSPHEAQKAFIYQLIFNSARRDGNMSIIREIHVFLVPKPIKSILHA